jgi:hypothetical protein
MQTPSDFRASSAVFLCGASWFGARHTIRQRGRYDGSVIRLCITGYRQENIAVVQRGTDGTGIDDAVSVYCKVYTTRL